MKMASDHLKITIAGLLVFCLLWPPCEMASFTLREGPRVPSDGNALAAFDVLVDGATPRRLTLMKGQQPIQAAEAFCSQLGLLETEEAEKDPNVLALASLIQQKLSERVEDEDEVAFVDVEVDGQKAMLRHKEGLDPFEEARAFCQFTGMAEDPDLTRCTQQLGGALLARVNELAKPPLTDQPLFALPITIKGQQATLNYFINQNPLEAAYAFLVAQGMEQDPDFEGYLKGLTAELETQLQKYMEQEKAASGQAAEREFSIPLDVNNVATELVFRESQDPAEVARAFCTRPELNLRTAGALSSCTSQAEAMVKSMLETSQPAAPATPEELMTVPLEVGAARFSISVRTGDTDGSCANRFCTENFDRLQVAMREAGVGTGLPMDMCVQYTSGLVTQVMTREQETAPAPAAAPTPAQPEEVGPLVTLNIKVKEDLPGATLNYYRGEDPLRVAQRFLIEHEMNPQFADEIVQILRNRVAQLDSEAPVPTGAAAAAAARELLFALPVTLREGAAPVNVEFYEGDEPLALARAFVTQQGIATDFVPMLTQELQKRLAAVRAAAAQPQEVVPEPLFTFDVLVSEDQPPLALSYYEGQQPVAVAKAFLSQHSLPEAYEESITSAIVSRVRSIIPEDKGEWLFSFGVRTTPNDPEIVFNYYQNDEPEAAVQAFIAEHALNPNLREDMLRGIQQMLGSKTEEASEAPATTPLLSLPIRRSPDSEPVMLNVFEGDSPVVVTENFLRKYDMDFSVKDDLVKHIQGRLAALQQEAQLETGMGEPGEVLFSIGVKLSEAGDPVPLPVRVGDSPTLAAERFLQEYNLDMNYKDAIISTIEARVKQLQRQKEDEQLKEEL